MASLRDYVPPPQQFQGSDLGRGPCGGVLLALGAYRPGWWVLLRPGRITHTAGRDLYRRRGPEAGASCLARAGRVVEGPLRSFRTRRVAVSLDVPRQGRPRGCGRGPLPRGRGPRRPPPPPTDSYASAETIRCVSPTRTAPRSGPWGSRTAWTTRTIFGSCCYSFAMEGPFRTDRTDGESAAGRGFRAQPLRGPAERRRLLRPSLRAPVSTSGGSRRTTRRISSSSPHRQRNNSPSAMCCWEAGPGHRRDAAACATSTASVTSTGSSASCTSVQRVHDEKDPWART